MFAALQDVLVEAQASHFEIGNILLWQHQFDLSVAIELAPLYLLACQRVLLDVLPLDVGPP
jgi:hypothetical protein